MTTNSILRATTDQILAIAPAPVKEMEEVGGIIIPEAAMAAVKAAMKESPMLNLEIAAVGPDCKVARKGMRVIVNKHHYNDATVEFEGIHYARFSEGTAFAIIASVPPELLVEKPLAAPEKLSIAEIQAGLGMAVLPTDDRDALPAETAKG